MPVIDRIVTFRSFLSVITGRTAAFTPITQINRPVSSDRMSNTGDSVSLNSSEASLLKDVFDMMLSRFRSASDRSKPVVTFKTPEELAKLVDFDIKTDAVDVERLKNFCKAAFEHSVNTDHPRFFNQQYGGVDKYGVAGDLVATALNTNAHTFEVAPFLVLAERAVIRKSMQLFGFKNGEGTFCPGGTYSSMLAMNLARHKKAPLCKAEGLAGSPQLVVFASEQAHYSASKNSALLGIGTKNCINIPCDGNGKMIVAELEKAVLAAKNQGAMPFLVIGTAGTTVLGAFDPLNDIADVCEKHGLWLHTDACWGGSVLFSEKYRHLCNGIERSDSIMWNPHKMMMMPIQCSLLLTKHNGLLCDVHSMEVPYLFQPKKPYDVKYDVSRDLIQCGRKSDALKLWLAWKGRGDEGFGKHVETAFQNAEYLLDELKKRENFRLVIEQPQFTNISFWYIPPSLRGKEENEEFWKQLHLVAPTIKTRMQKSGSLLVGYQPLGKTVNFFRMILLNRAVTHEDMDFLLDEIEREGADL